MRQHPLRILDRSECGAGVQWREFAEHAQLADHRAVEHDRLVGTRAAVDDPVRDAEHIGGAAASESTGVEVSSSTSESFRLVEPALTTRIPDTRQPAQYGQAQSAIAGSSIPCSRV